MALKGEPESNYGWSGKLILTEEQKKIARKNMRAAKFAYNWMRNQHEKYLVALERIIAAKEKQLAATVKTRKEYEKELHDYEKEQFKKFFGSHKNAICNTYKLRPKMIALKKENKNGEYDALIGVDSNSYIWAIEADYARALTNVKTFLPLNASAAWKRARKKAKKNKTEVIPPKFPRDFGFPRYKKEANAYYVNRFNVQRHLDYEHNKVFLSSLGWVKVYSHRKLPRFNFPSKLSANARVIFDGIDFHLTFSFYKEPELINATQTDVLGVSVGMNTLVGASNGNIWFDSQVLGKRVNWLDRRIRRLQDHLQRLYNGKSSKFVGLEGKEKYRTSSRLTRYLRYLIRKSQIEMNNYKKYQKEKLVNSILSTNPKMLVVQKLNVRKIQKDTRYSPKLQTLGLYDLQNSLMRKAVSYGIPVREYSSKVPLTNICSACGTTGTINRGTFVCPDCGHAVPANVNIAQNLKGNWSSAEIWTFKKGKKQGKKEDIQNIST